YLKKSLARIDFPPGCRASWPQAEGSRQMKRITVLSAAALLAGCGSLAQNADVPQGVYVGGRPTIADNSNVQIVDTGPSVQNGGRLVGGTSCKNKVWDPAPSRDNAIALMKKQ